MATGQRETNPQGLFKWIPILGAAGVFTFLGSTIATGVERSTALTLERQKYEYSLISGVIADQESEKHEIAAQLVFLLDIGAIQSLEEKKLRELANNPDNLPNTLPELTSIENEITNRTRDVVQGVSDSLGISESEAYELLQRMN